MREEIKTDEEINVILNNIPAMLIFYEDKMIITLDKKKLQECEVKPIILDETLNPQ